MPDKFTVRELNQIQLMFGGIGLESIVAKKPSKRPRKPAPGASIELTRFALAPGAWIIAGQATFLMNGSDDTEIEYQLSLSYIVGQKVIGGRHAYSRVRGGGSGSPLIIDAVQLDTFTTVSLRYAEVPFWPPGPVPDGPRRQPYTDARDPILIGTKTAGLLIY